jgi:hypothetical protein
MIPPSLPESQGAVQKLSYFYTIFRGNFPDICRMIQKLNNEPVFLDKRRNFEYSL